MKNKIMLFIEIPLIEKEINILVPINKKVGNVVEELIKYIDSNLVNFEFPKGNYSFFDKKTGKIIPNNLYIENSNLKNAQKLIII